jgi:glucose/arabinose dehydrogenase
MPLTGDHPMHPFIINARGNLFVDLGSATNACQSENRFPLSPGLNPCTELEARAGWRYDANKTDQNLSTAARHASGIRNGEGFGFDKAGRLYVTQHGRDQLSQDWPNPRHVDRSNGDDPHASALVGLAGTNNDN